MEVDLQIALEMERQITDDRKALACGCLIKVMCSFPSAPWVYLQYGPTLFCSLHVGNFGRLAWVSTLSGDYIAPYEVQKAVRDSIRVHLPYVVMDTWSGLLKERQALISLEGKHVIRHDGFVFAHP